MHLLPAFELLEQLAFHFPLPRVPIPVFETRNVDFAGEFVALAQLIQDYAFQGFAHFWRCEHHLAEHTILEIIGIPESSS